MNYFSLLEQQQQENGGRDFVIIERQPYSYEQIYAYCVDKYKGLGLSTGEAVMINSADLFFQLTAFLGLQSCGAVPIIGHYDLPPAVFAAMMRQNKVRYMLAEAVVEQPGWQFCRETAAGLLYELADVSPDYLPESICMGVLSSGSTGVPKVLYRTYESWGSFFAVQNEVFQITGRSVLFMEGSLSFTGNLNLLADVLYVGATAVLTNVFRCKSWLQMIAAYNADVIYLVPAKLRIMAKACRGRTYAKVRRVLSGSQLLSAETGRAITKAMPAAEIILYYGASELNYISWINFAAMADHPDSVGRPFDGVKVTVRDGLLYVDSPWFIYGQSRPATVQDTGSIDAGGYIIFGGREASFVNKGGYKVSCYKVERAVKEHSAVSDAVVLGYEEAGHGSQLAVFVVAASQLTRSGLYLFLNDKLARQEMPRRCFFLDEIPLNSRGKTDFAKLRIMLE